eukprot:COSAG04_NODE_10001_length_814_cov_0.538462_1_plen_139_part_00
MGWWWGREREWGGGDGGGGGGGSRPSSGSGSRPSSGSILRRPGSGSRPGSAPSGPRELPSDNERSRQVTYWRDKELADAAEPVTRELTRAEAEKVAQRRAELAKAEAEAADPEMVELNELLQLAQQHDLPGVDPNSIS